MSIPFSCHQGEEELEDDTRCHLRDVMGDIWVQEVRVPEEEMERNRELVTRLIFKTFIPEMRKADDLFNELFHMPYVSGSVGDGLRVMDALEFDILLILKIPDIEEFEVWDEEPGFVSLRMPEEIKTDLENDEPPYCELAEMTDSSGQYLSVVKFHRWIQSVVDQVLSQGYKRQGPGYTYTITRSVTGPAMTLQMEYKGKEVQKISIDLVPAIMLQKEILPNIDVRQEGHSTGFFVVPKPVKDSYNNVESELPWRLSFPGAERDLLHDTGCLKHALKMFKGLRNKLKLHGLKSYSIKTLFMWMRENVDENIWRDNLAETFVLALHQVQEQLRSCSLPYFWNPGLNLFEGIDGNQANTILERLASVEDDIVEDPDKLYDHFGFDD